MASQYLLISGGDAGSADIALTAGALSDAAVALQSEAPPDAVGGARCGGAAVGVATEYCPLSKDADSAKSAEPWRRAPKGTASAVKSWSAWLRPPLP